MRLVDGAAVTAWLDAYVKAWKTYSAEAIGALFAEDAIYANHPFDDPVTGRDAIVASWLENRDPEGTYDAHYEPIAIEGDVAVANGRSLYFKDATRTELARQWDNIFVIRFDRAGRCVSFREWYIPPRAQGQS